MVVFPPCKINLGLNVVRKRPDGFHDLETCFLPVPWTDVLEIIPADTFAFSSSGLPVAGDVQHNLCVKAYQLLKQDHALPPVAMHLHKIIPMGAGLGGGSADGAYVLRLLNTQFQLHCTPQQLSAYAAKLGSDCAFFIHDQPMLGTGRGEILSPISVRLGKKHLVIVKPDIHVSTAEAFAGIVPSEAEISVRDIVETHPVSAWKELLKNDFETSVFSKYPAIGQLKDKMYSLGAVYASMTGSGAAVFGIFDVRPDVEIHFTEGTRWDGTLTTDY